MTLELTMEQPVKPREERIRDVFKKNGQAIALRPLARACIAAGVWTASELEAIALRSVIEFCRKTLAIKDAAGLPENGPTTERDEDGAPVWKARQIWLFDDYAANVKEHLDQRDENHLIARALASEARDRYGRVIAIPALPVI